ncbi:MAG: sel1 repeat family protein [Proteobacteria bacterium]|nr:sel1 repeat family protein [Pseudomonadota bacterium]
MKRFYIVILLMLSGVQTTLADRNDGAYAYLQGDYETAYNTMISLANTSNDKLAQYYLGVMYMKGQGVEQDYEQAGEWFRKASKQGLGVAMYKLAGLYTKGNGVPKDLEFAYVWYSVGAIHKHQKSMNMIEKAKSNLSSEELASANQLIAEYVEKYGPKDEHEGKTVGTDPTAKK